MGWYDNIQVQRPDVGSPRDLLAGQAQIGQQLQQALAPLQDIARTQTVASGNQIAMDKANALVRPDMVKGSVNDLLAYKQQLSQAAMWGDKEAQARLADLGNTAMAGWEQAQNQQYRKDSLAQAKELAEMQNKTAMAHVGVQQGMLELSRQQNKFNNQLQTLELAAKGYIPDGKGGLVFSPQQSGAYKAMEAKQINENNEKIIQLASKAKLDDFVAGSKTAMNKGWGSALGATVGSSALSALFSEASTAINNNAIPQNIRAGLANALLQNNPQGIIDLLGQKYQYMQNGKTVEGIINPNRIGQTIKPSWAWTDEIEMPKTRLEKAKEDIEKTKQQFVK